MALRAYHLSRQEHASDFTVSSDLNSELSATSVAQSPRDKDALFQDLYPELKRLARARLRSVGGRTTLNTTMLVHDTYAKLAQSNCMEFPSNGQFLAYCAKVMRSAIIDLARSRQALRRGGNEQIIELNTEIMQSSADWIVDTPDVLRVHDALEQLKALDPRLESIVEMRYFAGLTEVEIGSALGISQRTVSREWERARALLHAILSQ